MPDIFQILAGAKIRERQDRPEKEKLASASVEFPPSSSYEKQLLDEIVVLIKSAKLGSNENATRKFASARSLEIQLLVSLKKQGLNLTARRIADEIGELRTEKSNARIHPGIRTKRWCI